MNASAFRKSLLGSSAMVLMLSTAPALADCSANNNITCSWTGTGGPGTPAHKEDGHGYDGGPGGTGPVWSLSIDGLSWVEDAGAGLSPINITSFGGVGAQGSDAEKMGDGDHGGSGGVGGDGGVISVTTGAGMSGSTSTSSGMTIVSWGGTGGAGALANLNTDDSQNGVGGVGGSGGAITVDLDGNFPSNSTNQARALVVTSNGGDGGYGRDWDAG